MYGESSIHRQRLDPAPRVVSQPESRSTRQAPSLLALIFGPFSFLYRLISASAGFLGYVFPFLPRLLSSLIPGSLVSRLSASNSPSSRRQLSAKDTASRFTREFEEEYGTHELPFFENGYAQALDLAKKDLGFLLVVLLSPEHDDNHQYVKDTLLSPQFVEFVKDSQNQIVLWGGNVQDSEAYQVSSALNCTKFPFAALICHTPSVSSTAMSVIARLTGPMNAATMITKIRSAISQNQEGLSRIRGTRAVQESERNLRAEQQSAYEISLAKDRERARQRREEEAVKAQAEKEALARQEAEARRVEDIGSWRRWRASKIIPEPSTSQQNSTRLSLRMPSGERVLRRFPADASIEELYAFVDCYDILEEVLQASEVPDGPPKDYEHSYGFQLASALPRKVFQCDKTATVGTEVGRSGNLLVEIIDGDEEEEED
jgi:FAS-associated factor 2